MRVRAIIITITSPEVPAANKAVWAQARAQVASRKSNPKVSRISCRLKTSFRLPSLIPALFETLFPVRGELVESLVT